MSDSLPQCNGEQILAEALRRNAVDTVYCIPGKSYPPVLDALYNADDIRTVVTRHEGAASNMAGAYGKLTGRPGICFVTRGPGATHAVNGVHTAQQDSTLMILFVGQMESAFKGREAFQEVDYVQMFSGLAKWAVEIDRIRRIPKIVGHAFSVAISGRPGPVVVALSKEILFGSVQVADAPVLRVPPGRPGATTMAKLRELLMNVRWPLLVLGGSGWDGAARKRLGAFVEANGLPMATSLRRQNLFDNRDPRYAGQLGFGAAPALLEWLRQADLLLVVGACLGETPSAGYSLVRSPAPAQTLIHVHPDSAELNRICLARLPIQATPCTFAEALADLTPLPSSTWQDWREAAHADYLAYPTPAANDPVIQGVDLASVIAYLSENLPDDVVIANDAGNCAVWVHRFYRYRQARTQLAPTDGAMGYGPPAAIVASLRDPQRSVACFAGDGCFMMYPQELAITAQFSATPVMIVVNNGMLGTIRMYQEREYPGRVSATRLDNPDFVALARAFGAHAERVECSADFPTAFRRAHESRRPVLLELLTDPRQITPQTRLA